MEFGIILIVFICFLLSLLAFYNRALNTIQDEQRAATRALIEAWMGKRHDKG